MHQGQLRGPGPIGTGGFPLSHPRLPTYLGVGGVVGGPGSGGVVMGAPLPCLGVETASWGNPGALLEIALRDQLKVPKNTHSNLPALEP